MKHIEFCLMKTKDSNMMLFVSDDLHDDSDDELDDLISEIFDDLADFEIEKVWIFIFEIYLDEFSEDDLGDDEVKSVNEKISKRLLKLALKMHIYDVKKR